MIDRQWLYVGAVLGFILLLVGMGWFVRDQFAPVEVGTPAPDFVATDLEGNTVRLADLRGEVIMLNIWATWCPPCVEEMPSMQRLYEDLSPHGLRMVAVSIDAPRGRRDRAGNPGGDIQEFAERFDLTFDIWHDPEGGIQRIYRTTGVPESFVIDRSGTIVRKVIGPTDWDSQRNQDLFLRLLEE